MKTTDLIMLAAAGIGAYAAYLQIRKMKGLPVEQASTSNSTYGGTNFASLLDGGFSGNRYDFYRATVNPMQTASMYAL